MMVRTRDPIRIAAIHKYIAEYCFEKKAETMAEVLPGSENPANNKTTK